MVAGKMNLVANMMRLVRVAQSRKWFVLVRHMTMKGVVALRKMLKDVVVGHKTMKEHVEHRKRLMDVEESHKMMKAVEVEGMTIVVVVSRPMVWNWID